MIKIEESPHLGSTFLDKSYTKGIKKVLHPIKAKMATNARKKYAEELKTLKRKNDFSKTLHKLHESPNTSDTQKTQKIKISDKMKSKIKNNYINNQKNLDNARKYPDTFIGTGFSTKATNKVSQLPQENSSGNHTYAKAYALA